MGQKLTDKDDEDDIKSIINKTLENKKREELLYKINTSEKKNFIKSIEIKSNNKYTYLQNNCKICEGKKGKNVVKTSKNIESLQKGIYNKNNNYENKKKNEIRNKIQITKENIFFKLKKDDSFKKYGIVYVTKNEQMKRNELKNNIDKELYLNHHFETLNLSLIQEIKKIRIFNYVKWQKKRLNYISHILLNFLILVLLFFYSNAKFIEYLQFSHNSQFSIKLNGKGVKYFINKNYGYSPSTVYINSEYQYDIQKFYNFTESINTVTFYISSNSFEGMFKDLGSITEINILSYDSSVNNIKRMFEGCKNLVTANIRNIYTNSYLQCDYLFQGCEKLSGLTLNSNQISVGSMEGMFYNCKSLISIGNFRFNTNNVGKMDNLFFGCSKLTNININNFSSNNLRSTISMFQGCNQLKTINFPTNFASSVTNMDKMFYECSSLTIIDFSSLKTSNVISMNYMFYGCSQLTQFRDTNFKSQSVVNMNYIFAKTGLTSIDLNILNINRVENADSMFLGCSNLQAITNYLNIVSTPVKSMSHLFDGCSKLEYIDLTKLNTPSLTNMDYMFQSCSKLTSVNLTGFDTSSVTTMVGLFKRCENINYIDFPILNTAVLKNMSHMFEKCHNLTSVDFSKIDTSNVVNMGYMFASCHSLISLDLKDLNTDSVIYMNHFLYDCINLTEFNSFFNATKVETMEYFFGNGLELISVDLSKLDTPSLVNMDYMFMNCPKLISVNFNNFDSSNVTSMIGLYKGCSSITFIDFHYLDGSSLKNMKSIFENCISLKSIDFSNFDTSKVLDMSYMFESCTELEKLDLFYLKTNSVINMSNMFGNCVKLKSIDISNLKAQNVQDMSFMFNSCANLVSIDLSHLNISIVENFNSMFNNCTQLSKVNLKNIITSYAENMTYMFNACNNLINIDLSGFNTSGLTSMKAMFSGCQKVKELNLENFDTTFVTNMEEMFSDCYELTSINFKNFNTSKIQTMRKMFYNCFKLDNLNLDNFDTINVKNMSYMFFGCMKLKSLNMNNFNTSNVINMDYMFSNCNSLKSLDLSNFITTKVINMSFMFSNCEALEFLNILNLDTKNVQDMKYIFSGCKGLSFLNLSEFETDSCENMEGMFSNCVSFQIIDLSNFRTDLVTNMENMFLGCSSLLFLNISNFDTSSLINMNNMFKDCTSLIYLDMGEFESNNDSIKDGIFNGIFEGVNICVNETGGNTSFVDNSLKFNCTGQCYNHQKNVLPNKKICVENCQVDDFLKYEYNNMCMKECPLGTHHIYRQEFICQKDVQCEEYQTNITNCEKKIGYFIDPKDGIYKPCYRSCQSCNATGDIYNKNCLEHLADIYLDYLQSIINSLNTTDIDNGVDMVHYEDDVIFMLTTTFNQKNNEYSNTSVIDLGECESKVREAYNISRNDSIYILKIDTYTPGFLTPKVDYELYYPSKSKNLTLVNLTICKNIPIDIFIPFNISKNDLDKYNPDSDLYNDICYTYTTDNGTDKPLADRRDDYINYNLSLCEEGCHFEDFDDVNKKAKCSCLVKIKLPIISEVKVDKNRLRESFLDIKNIINIKLLKCIHLLFDSKNIFTNYSNYMAVFLFIFSIIAIFLFSCKSYIKIKSFIIIIYKHRKKENEKKFKNIINNNNNINNQEQINNNHQNRNISENQRRRTIKHRSKNINLKDTKNKGIDLSSPCENKNMKKEDKNVIINSLQINNVNNYKSGQKKNNLLKISTNNKNKIPKSKTTKSSERQMGINNLRNSFLNKRINNSRQNTNKGNKAIIAKKVVKNSKYNESELNILSYQKALKHDKRTYFQYYISLLRTKHILIFSFFNFKDYNSSIIKMYIFFFSFQIDYSINAMFYSESTMHKIYLDGGNFDIIYQIPSMIYSSVLSIAFINLIKILGLCENNIMSLKNCKYQKIKETMKREMKCIQIKIFLFFIITYILLFAFWIYVGCFCAVYKNTQIHLLKEVATSLGVSFLTPFFISLLPGIFRIPSLKKNTNRIMLFQISKILQFLC